MLKSPHAYLVAVIEHSGERKCDERVCIESSAVVEVLAGGDRSAHLTTINLGFSKTKADLPSKGRKDVGVYVPNGKAYLDLSESYPASPDLIAKYQEAIALAKSTPDGSPHCQ